jgi:DMSO/TMAO reductase YedYZ heme-binding membrane subunit
MNVWWLAARTSGLLAWGAFAVSVGFGLLLATPWVPKAVARRIHRDAGIVGLALVALHIASIVADSYVHFGALQVLVPFTSAWRPVPVALGVVATWSVAAVGLTTLLRPRLAPSTWRAVHFLSYLGYAAATVHLLGAGADAGVPALRALVVMSTAAIAALSFAVMARFRKRVARPARPTRTASPAGAR